MTAEGGQIAVSRKTLDLLGLDRLLEALKSDGYILIGPRLRDQAVIYDEISSTADLPIGIGDEQEAGRYRLKPRSDSALFGYVVGPHSWKKFLFPPVQKLFSITRNGQSLSFQPSHESPKKLAFIGVRACELAAITIQDQVFIRGPFVDSGYALRRENVFLLAINCTEPGGTCFCASMNTGPQATAGFDLALTEILSPGPHRFLSTVGTELGSRLLNQVPASSAPPADEQWEEQALAESARKMGRRLDADGIKDLLYRNYESKDWDEIAARCLSCANCTLVCPTCFCSTIEDTTDLTGDHAERWRKWDSCFNADFSYIHGGVVRSTTRSRYRQWMVHKLATWHDQFGTSGCVGCGRCITWCPVGIDITHEAAAFREADARSQPQRQGAAG